MSEKQSPGGTKSDFEAAKGAAEARGRAQTAAAEGKASEAGAAAAEGKTGTPSVAPGEGKAGPAVGDAAAKAGALARAGRAAIATGAAARDDASGPQGDRYVVASHSQRGFRRGGHFFGPEKAVYTLTPALADRLRQDGQVHLSEYKEERDKGAVVIDDDGAPARDLVAPEAAVKQERSADFPFDPPMETPPQTVKPGKLGGDGEGV